MDMQVQGSTEAVKSLLVDGLQAVQGASNVGRQATQQIQQAATHPELKQMLQRGSEVTEKWRQRIDQAVQTVGAQGGNQSNPITEAIQQVGEKINGKMQDETARDLGIIATGQIALHYHIASFGTLAAYAKMLGMQQVAQTMGECLQEAKQADEKYTELAQRIAG